MTPPLNSFLSAGFFSDAPWAKIILALIPGIIALFTIDKPKKSALKNKSPRQKARMWAKPVGFMILTVASVSTGIILAFDDAQETKKTREEITRHWSAGAQHLLRIEGKLGDTEATQHYIETVAQLTKRLTDEKAGNAVERFFNSEAERSKLREATGNANKKVFGIHAPRITPVRDYMLAKFDSWINEIRKRGVEVDVKTKDILAVGIKFSESGDARSAVFKNGTTLLLQISPAVISEGGVAQNFHCQMPLLRSGELDGEIFVCDVEEKKYAVRNIRSKRFTFKSYEGNFENPIEDKDLISTLDKALDEVMGFVVEEAMASKE